MNSTRRGPKPRFPEGEVGRIVERLIAGERSDDVAAEYGLKGDSLRTTLRRRGIAVPKPVRPETPHGLARYNKGGCRCDVCTRAKADAARDHYRSRYGTEPPTHNASSYTNYGCRCDACTRANTDRGRERMERRKHNDQIAAIAKSMPR
jgi:hypothetical protein